jgi:hypothetical protein
MTEADVTRIGLVFGGAVFLSLASLAIRIGWILVRGLGRINPKQNPIYFWFLIGLCVVVGGVFMFTAIITPEHAG